jgi:phosphoglycerate dehydrogenase-like enzyme
MTNAKGQFSSSLAEYVMMACSYFAKDIPRLLRQKREKVWHDFDIMELRGKTMGIVGTCCYG